MFSVASMSIASPHGTGRCYCSGLTGACAYNISAAWNFITQNMDITVAMHQCGTARFGHDPRLPVLDFNCKAWDLDNLCVVDASFLPSSMAVYPSLTIVAQAVRRADHLLRDTFRVASRITS